MLVDCSGYCCAVSVFQRKASLLLPLLGINIAPIMLCSMSYSERRAIRRVSHRPDRTEPFHMTGPDRSIPYHTVSYHTTPYTIPQYTIRYVPYQLTSFRMYHKHTVPHTIPHTWYTTPCITSALPAAQMRVHTGCFVPGGHSFSDPRTRRRSAS